MVQLYCCQTVNVVSPNCIMSEIRDCGCVASVYKDKNQQMWLKQKIVYDKIQKPSHISFQYISVHSTSTFHVCSCVRMSCMKVGETEQSLPININEFYVYATGAVLFCYITGPGEFVKGKPLHILQRLRQQHNAELHWWLHLWNTQSSKSFPFSMLALMNMWYRAVLPGCANRVDTE